MDNTDIQKPDPEVIKYFQYLLSPINSSLYKCIYCIVRNKISADDIYQNTLLIAYTHLKQLRDENKFKSWIFKIAKREAFHFMNILNKTNSELPIELLENALSRDYNSGPTPEQIIISNELRNALINAINSLSHEDRDIVILYYYAEMSLKEISDLFSTNLNTIKARHRSIKQKIYKKLYSQGLVSEYKAKKPFIIPGGAGNVQR